MANPDIDYLHSGREPDAVTFIREETILITTKNSEAPAHRRDPSKFDDAELGSFEDVLFHPSDSSGDVKGTRVLSSGDIVFTSKKGPDTTGRASAALAKDLYERICSVCPLQTLGEAKGPSVVRQGPVYNARCYIAHDVSTHGPVNGTCINASKSVAEHTQLIVEPKLITITY
ncbi:MAG: hypothetical protein U0525_03925 [Patescibacteria group bacterium]